VTSHAADAINKVAKRLHFRSRANQECTRIPALIDRSEVTLDPRLVVRDGLLAKGFDMPTVTPSLTLPQPTLSPALAPKPAAPAAAAPAPATAAPSPASAPASPAPSATVTLSPQALSAMAAASHPAASPATPAPVALSHDGSVYEALKSGISTAVTGVGDAIADGAHAVVDGVETALSTANKVVVSTLELPFAAVSKACDAVGAVIDKL